MSTLTVDGILRSIHELPALPAVVLELIQSFGDSDISAEQLAAKISHDQAIAAKTLRLANSSFYGLPRQVTSITEATTILGLRTLRSVATAAGVVGAFPASGARDLILMRSGAIPSVRHSPRGPWHNAAIWTKIPLLPWGSCMTSAAWYWSAPTRLNTQRPSHTSWSTIA